MGRTTLLLVLGSVLCALLAVSVQLISFLLLDALPASVFLHPKDNVDVIAVLGYTLHRDGSLSPQLKARVKAAYDIWSMDLADWLVFSGGHPGDGERGEVSEAWAMAEWAHETLSPDGASGPPSPKWLLEGESTSTRENAVMTLRMLEGRGIPFGSVLVVTNPFHQLRAMLTFQCAAKQLRAAADQRTKVVLVRVAPSVGPVNLLDRAWIALGEPLREAAALAYYRYRGWLCTWGGHAGAGATDDVEKHVEED